MAQPTHEAQAAADAQNAHTAAETAMHAASVANKVAVHSVHITKHAKSALKDAREALHAARVDTKGLSGDQKESLKKAEAKLREATKKAQYGDVKNAKYVKADVDNKRLQKLDNKMEEVKATKGTSGDELDALMQSIDELQHQLKEKGGDNDIEAALIEIEDDLKEMKESGKYSEASLDEMKAEIEKLRVQIATLESESDAKPVAPAGIAQEEKSVQLKPLDETPAEEEEATPIEPKGLDIDTAMPYGDLEPFGREDTAQELTEDSIRESDGMVDQLERAEVAEEKRAVFRALTRLRGAAITSFDGIARSQTGNIDEYNKVHQWRSTHPLHHLADEESDVSKWAFPDNAD
jgi:DNA repair exonuclease SbcCD ATPase subunit